MRWIAKNILLAFPKTFLSLVIFSAIVCAYLSVRIPFDFSTESLFVSDDPHRVIFQKFKEDFGNDDKFVLIAFKKEDLFSPSVLRDIKSISDELRKLEYISESISLVDVMAAEDLLRRFQKQVNQFEKQLEMMGLPAGESQALLQLAEKRGIEPVIEQLKKARAQAEILDHPERIDTLKKRILKNPLYLNNVISKDGKTTGILIIISQEVTNNKKRSTLLNQINRVLTKKDRSQTFDFHLAGLPIVRSEYAKLISRDHLTFLPIMIPLFFLILYFIFKDPYQVVIPLITVGSAVVWTVGIMYLMGESINIISNVIYVLLLVIGVASSIHVINGYNDELREGKDKKAALIATVEHLGRACFITAFTTAIGFMSLLVTDIRLIQQFGIYSALGVMLNFVAAAFITPLVLYFAPEPNLEVRDEEPENKLLQRILKTVAFLNRKYPYTILLLFIFTLPLWLMSIGYLKIDSQMLDEISEENKVVKANQFVEKNLSGVLPLEILLTEKKEGLFRDPEELERIDKFQKFVSKQTIVTNVISLLDVMKMANMVANNYDKKYYRIPKDKKVIEKIYQFVEVMTKEERGVFRFMAHNQSSFRLSVRIEDAGSNAHFELVKNMEGYIKREGKLDKNFKVIFTGETHMAAVVLKRLVGSMLSSIFMAAGIIFLVMIVMFRSLQISLLSLIPNTLPILFTMGVMGMTGIVLRTSTVVIFTISLGIAVDDTIHYLVRYRTLTQQEGTSAIEAMKGSILTTGKALVWTTIVICGGLLVLVTSSFRATVDFGILGSVTLWAALFGDLLILPVCLLIFMYGHDDGEDESED